jgi:hypothetical protein
MALTGALCMSLFAVTGLTNQSLRACVAGLLSQPYTRNQMTYDLRRLRLKGLIKRLPHRNTYILTRRATRRDLLHQSPQQTAPATPGRQCTTRTATRTPSPPHPRPRRQRLHRTSPNNRLKLGSSLTVEATKGR